MSLTQVWVLKGVMVAFASYGSIRALRRTEVVPCVNAILESLLRCLFVMGAVIAGLVLSVYLLR